MKLMKHITIALVLCAIPAMAFGQTVTCDDCTHTVSYYKGMGGMIATADGADMVTFVTSCGGVTRSGELEANDDGVVSMLFAGDYACEAEMGGSFELGPIMDGGWFWINDADNSAVGNLVAMDILDNDATDLTSAGNGVSMTMGSGAVFLKEAASGRVGILPNILPEPPAPAAVVCGPRRNSSWPYAYDGQQTGSCMLGGGKTKIRLIGPGAYNSRGMITTGMVTRPSVGSITVNADLWVDESGSYSTDTSGANSAPSADSIRKGWIGKTAVGQSDHNANWLTSTWTIALDSGDPQTGDTAGAGVELTENGGSGVGDGQATITVSANGDYCPAKGTQYTATIHVIAVPSSGGDADDIHPAVAVGRAAGFAASTQATFGAATGLRVVCAPRAAANQGQELVPDNPFPTDK